MLEESVVYQDILAKGVERGLQQGIQQDLQQGIDRERRLILQQATHRFGKLSPTLHKRFARLSADEIEQLGLALFDFKEKTNLSVWLKRRAP